MANQNNFFLTDTSAVRKVDTIELNHPDWTVPFYFQNEWIDEDMIATNEDSVAVTYQYQLFEVDRGNVMADLDQGVSITFADYIDELKNAINSADHMKAITLKHRMFRDDDLSSPLDFIQTLQVLKVNNDSNGVVTFEASAEQLNSVKTGDVYTLNKYPLLKGVI